jgi:hypothetical protein
MADLQRAKALAESVTWTEVGEIMGAHPSTIMTLLRRQGMKPDITKRPPPEPKHADLLRKAIAIRNTEHKSWGIIAEEIDWPLGASRSRHRRTSLRSSCARYCETFGLRLWEGQPEKRYFKHDPKD